MLNKNLFILSIKSSDTFSHTSGKIKNNDNGDIAIDHFHKFKEDIDLMAEINMSAYRFSIDHGGTPEECRECIELGFTSVMMDGSLLSDQKTPSNFEYNVKVTRETVKIAHSKGVSVIVSEEEAAEFFIDFA